MPQWTGNLWMGKGYDWTAQHTQLALDLLRAGPERFAPRDPQRMGATWIHGLGGRDQDLCVPLEHIEGHLLIVGTTGAGKTRAFDLLVTQAVLRGEAVIIIDPKGDQDLRRTAERACVLAGTPARFVYFHPAFPGESVRIDPLHSFNRPTELANRVAALIPSETGNDPFEAFGQMALSHVVQGLLAVNERPSLVTLRHYLEGGAVALVERVLLRYFAEHRPQWVAETDTLLARARDGNARVKGLLRYYRERVAPTQPSTVIEGLAGMYEHEAVHFSKMIASLIIQLLNKGRGAGLRLAIATQTFADFSARTGSEAKARQVLGNINNVVALRVLDAETQTYVAESLPMARVTSIMRAHGSTSDSTNPLLYTGNTGERITEEEVELFPPALLGQLPNFEYIALWSGGRVSKGRLPILGAPRGADRAATADAVPPAAPAGAVP